MGDIDDYPELGNICWGNSRGLYRVPRSWEGHLRRLFLAINPNADYWAETYDNDVFSTMRYYWGDCTCDVGDGVDPVGHSPKCLLAKPNFHYKPIDYQLQWYKYPLRDSWASHDLTEVEFINIIDDCIRSIRDEGR